MKKYFVTVLILIGFLSFFCSCEYETEQDYFVNLTKPSEDIKATINLQNITENETIYIYTATSMGYNVDTDDRRLLDISFTLDDRVIASQANIIYISPYSFDDKDHILKVKISLSSNTGSLAEKLHLEQYTGEFSYKIKFVKTDLKLNISQQTTEDGFLKLIWDKPDLQQTPIDKYVISYYDSESQTTKEFEVKDNTFFVDDTYIYGFREYIIKTYFEDNKIQTWTDYFIAEYKELTIDDLNLDLHQERTQEGCFKLIWNNPQIMRMPVKKYILEYYDEQQGGRQTINIAPKDLSTTSFVDENYAYGDREYRLMVDLDYLSISTKYIPIYRKLTKEDFTFEDISLEKIRISWPKNEFNCIQIIRLFDDKNILIPEGVNSIDIDRLPFPYTAWRWSNYNMIDVHLLGKKTSYNLTYHPSFFSQGSVGTNFFYNQFHIEDDPLGFVSYPKGNRIYTLARKGIYSTDMKTMTVTQLLSFDEAIGTSMACDPYSTKVATGYNGTVSIYKDHNFTNPIKFELAYGLYPRIDALKFITNNKLIVLNFISNNWAEVVNNTILSIFDTDTGSHLYNISIPDVGKVVGEVKISSDGKYMFVETFRYNDNTSLQGDIYELNGNQANLLKSYSYNDLMADGPFIYFNSSNPTQLIQGNNNKFRVEELPSFNKIAEVNGQFSSVDVVNGNFLYTTSGELYQYINVMDPTLSKVLFRWKIDSGEPLSYDNILVSPSMHAWGSYWNISKFIKKSK